jgi:hypothetical protein
MAEESVDSPAPREPATKAPIRKTHAWIFDVGGIARKGWLQIIEEGGGDAKPADRGWRPIASFPSSGTSSTRIFLWADDVDKYIARIDVGTDRRWIVMEGLPALLGNAASLSALIEMGRTGSRR